MTLSLSTPSPYRPSHILTNCHISSSFSNFSIQIPKPVPYQILLEDQYLKEINNAKQEFDMFGFGWSINYLNKVD